MDTADTRELALDSIALLAQLAMRESGAGRFTLFAIHPSNGERTPLRSSGVDESQAPQVASFPLEAGGTISGRIDFGFPGPVPAAARQELTRFVSSIETVWALNEGEGIYRTTAARIAQMEIAVALSKITSRVQGVLDRPESRPTAFTGVSKHIETILSSQKALTSLRQLEADLEREIAERRLAEEAKQVLQRSLGISEEKAHHQLRLTSRRTRRPLLDVARELLDAQR